MTADDEKQISYKGQDKLLELLEKIPDKSVRKEILSMFHNTVIEYPNAQIMILDKNGTFLFHNYSIHGISTRELIGSSYLSTFGGKVSENAIKYLKEGFKNALKGKRKKYDVALSNGKKYVATFIPIEKSEEISYVIIAAKEITYQMEAEKLKKTKQLYEEQVKDVVVTRVSIPDGMCEYISPSFKTMFGWKLEEGMDEFSLFVSKLHPDCVGEMVEKWEKLLEGEVPPEVTYRILTKKRGYRWFHHTNSGVYDSAGDLTAVECVVKDISEEKEINERFNELEEKFDIILREGKVAVGTVLYDTNPHKHFFSESIKNITGYNAKDFLLDPELWIKILYAKDFNRVVDEYTRQLNQEDDVNLICRIVRRDGFFGKVKVWGKLFRDDKGKLTRGEYIYLDISDEEVHNELLDFFARKIAEDEIKKKKGGEQAYIR